MADVIQQVRTELDEIVSGRFFLLSGIATCLQRVSANPVSKMFRISDLGWQQRQGMIFIFHVGLALVDASVV